MVAYRTARPEERDAYIELANYAFGFDAETLLPKAYAAPFDPSPFHKVAVNESGKLCAEVAVLPQELTVAGRELRVGFLGMVSVHPKFRGQGHMKKLMNLWIEEARGQYDMLALYGQRQRYEYFGFTGGGLRRRFFVEEANVRHGLREVSDAGISFCPFFEADGAADFAERLNRSRIAFAERRADPGAPALDHMRALGLSFPAVSYNVGRLLEEKRICELGAADNALGRKGTLLAFNARFSYLAGADIGRDRIRVMCADMGGEILSFRQRQIRQGEDVVRQAAEEIRRAAEDAGAPLSDVACLGVGTPGIYDRETDSLRLAPFAEAWSKDLMRKLRDEFSMDIVLENSVNLGAVGERWKGAARGFDSVLYVDLGVGLGAAAIIDGTLIRGRHGAFGEIAYMTLEKDRLPRAFTEEGALERLLPSRLIGEQIAGGESEDGLGGVLRRLEESGACPGAADVPDYFAMALVNAIAVVDPELLVIAGRLGCALYGAFRERIDAQIRASVPFPPEIRCTALAEKAGVCGAIAAAMLHADEAYTNRKRFI